MTTDSDWRALLTDYKAIVDQFDAVSRALSAALAKPGKQTVISLLWWRPRQAPGTPLFSRERV